MSYYLKGWDMSKSQSVFNIANRYVQGNDSVMEGYQGKTVFLSRQEKMKYFYK